MGADMDILRNEALLEIRKRDAEIERLRDRELELLRKIEALVVSRERLQATIRQLGEMADCCTYDALREICSTCRCPRRTDNEQGESKNG